MDDYGVHGANNTVSATETIDPGGTDTVISLGTEWIRAVAVDGCATVLTDDGQKRVGELHPSLRRALRLVGRAWDLSKACKRLPGFPGHAPFTCIAVLDPHSKRTVYFEHLPLAFGGRMNVLSFNWVARALWWTLVVGLGLPITRSCANRSVP